MHPVVEMVLQTPSLSIIQTNVCSLQNKMDLQHTKCQVERSFRDTCIIVMTETWLVPDTEVNFDHFYTMRAERTSQLDKEKGVGVCTFINKRLCKIELTTQSAHLMCRC